jgi:hypothetical protein
MEKAQADNAVGEIFRTGDAAEIFARGFRWLLAYRGIMEQYVKHAGSKPESDPYAAPRSTKAYENASLDFARELGGAAEPLLRQARLQHTTQLDPELCRKLRQLCASHLARNEAEGDFPVILALLSNRNNYCGPAVRGVFFVGVPRGRHAAPIDRGRAFPAGWGAFGTDAFRLGQFPPFIPVGGERVYLARQFALLAVTHGTGPYPPGAPTPALHTRERERKISKGRRWRVGVVDVLGAQGELGLRLDHAARRFSCSSYSDTVCTSRIVSRLEWALEECRKARTQLIVIPELTAGEELRKPVLGKMLEWSRRRGPSGLPLVLMGMLHQNAPGGTGFRNQPLVVARDGIVPWDYWKHRQFIFTVDGVQYWEALDTTVPNVLAVDTEIGRVAVVICLDYLDRDVQIALEDLKANVLVVLAMTPRESVGRDFYPVADVFASGWQAVTIFCNSSFHFRTAPAPHASEKKRRRNKSAPATLGFVHTNTRIPSDSRWKAHYLRDPTVSAMVGLYTLKHSDKDGLGVSVRPKVYRDPPAANP